MERVKVKICGLRSFEEARAALDLGADAIGFNFWPSSSRYITPGEARQIVSRLAPFGCFVGVFVNEDLERIFEIYHFVGLSAIQLHGDETPDFCAKLAGLKLIKALKVVPGFNPLWVRNYPSSAVLLDSGGGTGKTFDWAIAVEARKHAPIILAGGLTPENVADAILKVRPVAVDVSSGVESAPGRKDPARMRDFIEAVSRANLALSSARLS
jgi:phosphoribosylanthranilate isomerase